jgi:spermidine synthase
MLTQSRPDRDIDSGGEMTKDLRGTAPRSIILLIFLASGAAGLVYQVVWTRLLTLVLGSTIFAVTAVLTSFMAGLGLGSFVLSRIADRPLRSLRLYALLEIAIGVYALLFPLFLEVVEAAYSRIGQTLEPGLSPLKFILCVAILILPTAFMGGTLPLLCRYLVRHLGIATREIAYLYGINTAGAVLGTFAAGFVLIPEIGLRWSMYIAAVTNLVMGLAALALSRNELPYSVPGSTTSKPQRVAPATEGLDRRRVHLALATMFFSGLLSLGYEVVWTRLLLLYLGSTTYTFSTMLTTFLFGIAVGSFAVGAVASKIKRPLLLLALAEIAIGASIFLTAPALWKVSAVMEAPSFEALPWAAYNLARFGLCFAVMILPTLLMGATFPLATQVVLQSPDRVGRSVGNVYSINTLGAIFGSLLAGLVLLPGIGPAKTLALLSLGNLLLGAMVLLAGGRPAWRRWAVAATLPVVALVVVHTPLTDLMRRTVVERISSEGSILFEGDGLESHVATTESPFGFRYLWINGDVVASSPGSVSGHSTLGHLPMLFAGENRSVLVVGLGTGIGAGSASLYDPEDMDLTEISPLVVENGAYFRFDNHNVTEQPGARVIVDDARNFIQLTDKTYDVITAEPLHPWKMGTANLYTVEYYRACRGLMNPGGVVVQWMPLYGPSLQDIQDIIRTFMEVFPETSLWVFGYDAAVLGHTSPFGLNLVELQERLETPGVLEDLERTNITGLLDLLNHLVMGPKDVAEFCTNGRIMSDWHPHIEYEGPKNVHEGESTREIQQSFFLLRCDPADYVTRWPESFRDSLEEAMSRQRVAWRLTQEGVIAQSAGRYEESRRKLIDALDRAPWLGDARFYLSRTYFIMTQSLIERGGLEAYRVAHPYLEEALKYAPNSPSILYRVALLSEEIGKSEEARAYWQRLVDSLPPDAPRGALARSRLRRLSP